MNDIEEIIDLIQILDEHVDFEDSDLNNEFREYVPFIKQALKEKAERENPKPLISANCGDEMLCPHCNIDLMCEFLEPQEEKYCPFCGWAVDFCSTPTYGEKEVNNG